MQAIDVGASGSVDLDLAKHSRVVLEMRGDEALGARVPVGSTGYVELEPGEGTELGDEREEDTELVHREAQGLDAAGGMAHETGVDSFFDAHNSR